MIVMKRENNNNKKHNKNVQWKNNKNKKNFSSFNSTKSTTNGLLVVLPNARNFTPGQRHQTKRIQQQTDTNIKINNNKNKKNAT